MGKKVTEVVDSKAEARFSAAIERAKALGYLEEMLRVAHNDPAWRAGVERSLAQDGALKRHNQGGARPSDLWCNSLLHRRVLQALAEDTELLVQIAKANPRIAEFASRDDAGAEGLTEFDPITAVMAAYCLDIDGEALVSVIERACDTLESRRPLAAPECEAAEEEQAPYATPTRDGLPEDGELVAELQALRALQREWERQERQLKRQLADRVQEVARKDRAAQELRDQLRESMAAGKDAADECSRLRAERDELRRQCDRLKAQAASSQAGKRTVEQNAERESCRLLETITDLREQLGAARDLNSAYSRQVASLEAELDEERQARRELDETLAGFGFDDLARSGQSLNEAVETLVKFERSVSEYAARQAEKEQERLRLKEAADMERLAAQQARDSQAQAEIAWSMREQDRLEQQEAELFPDGQVDHIIIDGHNLVHRVFRPEDEKSTRAWLERLVGELAQRLEDRGWASRIHLVFDTKYESNTRGAGHGLTVYFQNNNGLGGGGADARISQLLGEYNPASKYMVVSTDRKHVWSDAIKQMNDAGVDVDLVQVELLAQYLQTLDEVLG